MDDEHHRDARRLLEGVEPLATLDLAFYEVNNVAVRAWRDLEAAQRLRDRLAAVGDDGGIVRADAQLLETASTLAHEQGLSAYDAAYVAAAGRAHAQLVSCDVRDLVSRDLARLPADTSTA